MKRAASALYLRHPALESVEDLREQVARSTGAMDALLLARLNAAELLEQLFAAEIELAEQAKARSAAEVRRMASALLAIEIREAGTDAEARRAFLDAADRAGIERRRALRLAREIETRERFEKAQELVQRAVGDAASESLGSASIEDRTREEAQKLLSAGRKRRELAGIIAPKIGRSTRHVRNILNKLGI
jgi:hypothetical protein